MILELLAPRPPLSEYVELLTYYEGYNPGYNIEKILPEGVVEVIIDLTDDPKFIYDNESLARIQTCRRAWVSGMRSSFISISVVNRSAMFVIRFRPGKAWPFLQIPLSEIDNMVVDADLVLGSSFESLRQVLMNTEGIAQKFSVAEQFIFCRMKDYFSIHPGVEFALSTITNNPTTASIKEIVGKTGYSHKHVLSLFSKYVGLSPKQFLRIVKFQQVVRAIEQRKKIEWTQLAFDCGYYDQAHFINDFKEFSGLSPTEYLKVKGDIVNYIPVR